MVKSVCLTNKRSPVRLRLFPRKQFYMAKFTKSPIKSLTDKMFERIAEPNVKTSKLAEIIKLAYECKEGLLEPGGLPENDWWAHQGIKDFTEIIVRANYKAHTILNPGLVPDDLEDQIKEALKDVTEKINSKRIF